VDTKTNAAVRQVLKEASEHGHFFDFSDAERLNWMIAKAFQIGKEQNHDSSNYRQNLEIADSGELMHKRSKPMRRPRCRSSAKRWRPP
jgi:hypothetical protein